VYHSVVPETASPNVDYIPSSGVLKFAPFEETVSLSVPIVGDTTVEADETFVVRITSVHAQDVCAVTSTDTLGTIVDDDAPALSTREVEHGSSGWHTLTMGRGTGEWSDVFRLRQAPFASYEAVVDGASGDMLPFTVERLAADNSTVLSSGASAGTAASVRWENASVATTDNQHLRVRSTGCTSGCGADDVYRLRVYETTGAIPRFNNTGGQITVLVLQNTTSYPVAGHVRFWHPTGALLASRDVSLGPRASEVLNTTLIPVLAGNVGSITIGHDGPYAALAGKTISLDPNTGFSFDSPLLNRPR